MASRTTWRRGLTLQIHARARSFALLSLWYALAGSSRLRQADCDCLLTVADGLARTTALELPSLHLVHRPLDSPAACFAVLARHRLTPPSPRPEIGRIVENRPRLLPPRRRPPGMPGARPSGHRR